MIRSTLSALALPACMLAFAPAALADPACEPDIVSPADGAIVSASPTIQATAINKEGCDILVKFVYLNIEHVESGNVVYSFDDTLAEGLTGQYWEPGTLWLDHQIPAGELTSGERYQAWVRYAVRTPLRDWDKVEYPRTDRVSFTVRSEEPDHTIIISGSGGGSDYTIFGGGQLEQVDGKIDKHPVTIQSDDEVWGDVARGSVGAGSDGFNVYGDLPSIILDNPDQAVIEVDGETFIQIVITSENITGDTGYTISQGGRLEQVDGRLMGYDVTIQGSDQVQGNRADGEVGEGADGFRVYGASPGITLDNQDNAIVFVNGEPD